MPARKTASKAAPKRGAKTAGKAAGKTAGKTAGKGAAKTAGMTVRKTAGITAASKMEVTLHTAVLDIVIAWPVGARLKELQRQVMEWSHIVRNRRRWTRTEQSDNQQSGRAKEFLQFLGISETERRTLATSQRVTVVIPFAGEETAWESRILPWEFLLTAGTKELRTGSLVVSRWLQHDSTTPSVGSKPSVLFVEGLPKALMDQWDFEDECRLVRASTASEEKFRRLCSPTRAELKDAIKSHKPDIVHLAGFDNHQGLALTVDAPTDAVQDGYLLCKAGNAVDPVSADDLAKIFAAAGHKPALVFCNIWNSGARVAPLLVGAGAGASVGFQDSLDDALAELFLGTFYQELTAHQDVEVAFENAWTALRSQPKPLRGTGISLWRGGLWNAEAARAPKADAQPERKATSLALASSTFAAEELRDLFSFTVEPVPEISYALLHNNRDLFSRFVVRKLRPERVDGLQVEVSLYVGDGTNPFRQSFSMTESVLDLAPIIRVALTSQLARSVDELLRSSLYVSIRWGAHEVFSQSFPVTLSPIDQWADTDADRLLLPSFVFPRDLAVRQILKEAEQYVTALRDDPTAGFDGYQCIDEDAANPAIDVDNQVQAIWYALLYKVPVSYINPPPTYSVSSQRIRTPSEVVNSAFGTCIDLALLTASCLEA
ncbi:MAG: CHAT domain-containing protein, partial [Gemmatimonadaceae bacterium]